MKIKPCLKCRSTDVEFWNCGYTTFNVCGVKCTKCGREVKLPGDWEKSEGFKEWNKVNGKLTDKQKVNRLRKQIRSMNKEPIV